MRAVAHPWHKHRLPFRHPAHGFKISQQGFVELGIFSVEANAGVLDAGSDKDQQRGHSHAQPKAVARQLLQAQQDQGEEGQRDADIGQSVKISEGGRIAQRQGPAKAGQREDRPQNFVANERQPQQGGAERQPPQDAGSGPGFGARQDVRKRHLADAMKLLPQEAGPSQSLGVSGVKFFVQSDAIPHGVEGRQVRQRRFALQREKFIGEVET